MKKTPGRPAEPDTGDIRWRRLSRRERRILDKNGNCADDWNNLLVTDGFSPATIRHSSFRGVTRIGRQLKISLNCRDLALPVGIYNSTIISCDIGDNVAIHNVRYLSQYEIDSEVALFNIDEMKTTKEARFGNGGSIAVANENGGRKIGSFSGMNVADAYLWSRNREYAYIYSP